MQLTGKFLLLVSGKLFLCIEEGGGIENTMRWRGPEVTNYKTARTILDLERYVNLFISRRIACRLRGLLAVFI